MNLLDNILSLIKPKFYTCPEDFGAKGDMIADDIIPIEKATKYAMDNNLELKMLKRYRISRQWVIGNKLIDEVDFSYHVCASAPSYNINIDHYAVPITITGGSNTVIYGDFVADKLTAIIYYCVLPWRLSTFELTPTINNLNISGKGTYTNGVWNNQKDQNLSQNQLGLMVVDAYNLKSSGCSFSGLKMGVISNNCYFSNWQNFKFNYCGLGFYSVEQNSSIISNFNAGFCDVAYNPQGVAVAINTMNTESCVTALDLYGCSNHIYNACYFESHLPNIGRYEIYAGVSDISIISPDLEGGQGTDAITINSGLFSALTPPPEYGWNGLMLIEKNCGRIKLNDCTGSGNIKNKSKELTQNIIGNYKNIQGNIDGIS